MSTGVFLRCYPQEGHFDKQPKGTTVDALDYIIRSLHMHNGRRRVRNAQHKMRWYCYSQNQSEYV